MKSPRVTIVVLNWNGRDDTLECLDSLGRITYPNLEVVVVDNGSADDSVTAFRAAYPALRIIETGRNLGYAGGNNVGIRAAVEAGADYVLLLNNDTYVDPGFLDRIVAVAEENPRAACVGPKILFADPPDEIWFAGARWNQGKHSVEDLLLHHKDSEANEGVLQSDYVTGCAMLIRASRVADVGLLDETYFLVFEEVDWCSRARKLGYQCLIVLDARIWHKVSVSMGGRRSPLGLYFYQRNMLLWAERNLGRREARQVRRNALWNFLRRLAFVNGDPPRPYSLRHHYWLLHRRLKDWDDQKRFILASALGLRDYWLRRFGDCPESIRAMMRR